MKTYKVTSHAKHRFRERLDIPFSSDCMKQFKKALKYGWNPDHYTGAFKQYLESHKRGKNSGIKVYAENIYIYKGSTLITVYPIPQKYSPSKIHTARYRSENPYLVELSKIVNSDSIELELLTEAPHDYVAGLSIDGQFMNYGMGNSPQRAKNHAIRTYLKSIGKEKEAIYFNDQAIQRDEKHDTQRIEDIKRGVQENNIINHKEDSGTRSPEEIK